MKNIKAFPPIPYILIIKYLFPWNLIPFPSYVNNVLNFFQLHTKIGFNHFHNLLTLGISTLWAYAPCIKKIVFILTASGVNCDDTKRCNSRLFSHSDVLYYYKVHIPLFYTVSRPTTAVQCFAYLGMSWCSFCFQTLW